MTSKPKQFQVFRDDQAHYRWRLWSVNNRIIAVSGEGYWNRADCLNAIELVKRSGDAPTRD